MANEMDCIVRPQIMFIAHLEMRLLDRSLVNGSPAERKDIVVGKRKEAGGAGVACRQQRMYWQNSQEVNTASSAGPIFLSSLFLCSECVNDRFLSLSALCLSS